MASDNKDNQDPAKTEDDAPTAETATTDESSPASDDERTVEMSAANSEAPEAPPVAEAQDEAAPEPATETAAPEAPASAPADTAGHGVHDDELWMVSDHSDGGHEYDPPAHRFILSFLLVLTIAVVASGILISQFFQNETRDLLQTQAEETPYRTLNALTKAATDKLSTYAKVGNSYRIPVTEAERLLLADSTRLKAWPSTKPASKKATTPGTTRPVPGAKLKDARLKGLKRAVRVRQPIRPPSVAPKMRTKTKAATPTAKPTKVKATAKPAPKKAAKPAPKKAAKPAPKVTKKPAPLPPGVAPCVRKSFRTGQVRAVCRKGQKSAKRWMQRYVRRWKKTLGIKVTCKSCHTALGPNYPLKSNGLRLFRDYMKKLKAAPKGADARRLLSPLIASLR